jgi:hypothetical protein
MTESSFVRERYSAALGQQFENDTIITTSVTAATD